jgi:hypothetical protein
LESIVERHGWIAESLLEHLPPELDLRDKSVCEVGSGDCLAAVSLYLAKGASHVDIVDAAPLVVNRKQFDLLEALKEQELPMDTGIILRRSSPQLDANRVSHRSCYMENFSAADKYDFLSSFSVIERVEDLGAFYFSCWKALKREGWMLHIIDLGGHDQFEDPLPLLDFQTYPDWLFSLMYPRHYRATRRFFGEHKQALTHAGFIIKDIKFGAKRTPPIWLKFGPSCGLRHGRGPETKWAPSSSRSWRAMNEEALVPQLLSSNKSR